MAGRPARKAREAQARAEQEAQHLADGGILDAEPSAPQPRPPPRSLRFGPPAIRAVQPQPALATSGVVTRNTVDYTAASELGRLAQVLQVGTPVRVERIKPHWCAGIVESLYTLESGRLDELVDYLKEEWGGQSYRITVIQPNGAPAFEARLPVCAPPRYEGKTIFRETWGGEVDPESQSRKRRDNPEPLRVVAPREGERFGEIREIFELVGGMLKESNERSLDAIRDVVGNSRDQNQELIAALVEKNGQESGGGLVKQLMEFSDAQAALQRVGKKVFGAAEPKEEEDDVMKGAMKHAAKDFFGSVISSHFAPKASAQANPQPNPARPRAPAPTRVRARGNPSKPPQMPMIPDAEVSGQTRRR